MPAGNSSKADFDMQRSLLYILFFFLIALSGCSSPKDATTFYLVRHAEKMNDGTKDPPLSEAGELRAHLLAEMLSDIKFDAIYASDFKRTRSTASPISELQERVITLYDPRDLDSFMDHLFKNHKGQTVLVVGHSNTTPNLVNKMVGAEKHPQLDESEYDKIFIVHASQGGNGKSSMLKMERQ